MDAPHLKNLGANESKNLDLYLRLIISYVDRYDL